MSLLKFLTIFLYQRCQLHDTLDTGKFLKGWVCIASVYKNRSDPCSKGSQNVGVVLVSYMDSLMGVHVGLPERGLENGEMRFPRANLLRSYNKVQVCCEAKV